MENKKLGIVIVCKEFIDNHWDIVTLIFDKIKVLKIEPTNFYKGVFREVSVYYCESELFDNTKEGDKIQEYEILFTRNNDDKITYTIQKVI